MTIKVLCLNIWYGGKIRDALCDFVKTQDADILLLQEVYEDENLFPHYPNRHYAGEVLHLMDGRRRVVGNAIYSKYPITASHIEFLFEPFGIGDESKRETFPFWPINLESALVDLGQTQLNVFNIHGVWGEDGNDNERRLKMSEKIIAAVKEKKHVVLAGDFNTDERTKTIGNIEQYLTNIFKGERETSFNMKRKNPPGTYGLAIVDFIFVSPDIKVLSHASPDVDISDHLPLLATLQIN